MKTFPLVYDCTHRVQLLLMIVASQQRGTLPALCSLDQLLSDLQPEVGLVALHIAQQCSQLMEATVHQTE